MTFPSEIWILLIVCAACCSIGFKKFIYFISIGYGSAIAGAGVFLIIYYWREISLVVALQCIVLIVYGVRLGGYLLIRERNSYSYQKTVKGYVKDDTQMSFVRKGIIWICVSILYVMQVSPIFYRLANQDGTSVASYISLCVMIVGVWMETAADMQKSRAKKQNPDRYCDSGLYRIVRCPNYLGEILFWTGVIISGFTTLTGFGQWIIAIAGYLLICYIMLSGSKRLEERQDRNYGKSHEYQVYKKKTPILIPLIPLYSLQSCRWIISGL